VSKNRWSVSSDAQSFRSQIQLTDTSATYCVQKSSPQIPTGCHCATGRNKEIRRSNTNVSVHTYLPPLSITMSLLMVAVTVNICMVMQVMTRQARTAPHCLLQSCRRALWHLLPVAASQTVHLPQRSWLTLAAEGQLDCCA